MTGLNEGKYNVGGAAMVSWGDQSPEVDAIPKLWNGGDFRHYMGSDFPNNLNLIGWRCVVGGTPGTWIEVRSQLFTVHLSYGRQDGTGTLPAPAEATPAFYLHADTDLSVMQSFAGSPGSIWEFPVPFAVPAGHFAIRLNVYQCLLTPVPMQTAVLLVSGTKNGAITTTTSPNLDGLIDTPVLIAPSGAPLNPPDTVGIFVETLQVSSGTLTMTAEIIIG